MQPTAQETVILKRSTTSTESDDLPAQLMDNYADSLFFLVKRALGARLFARSVGSDDFDSTEVALATLVPELIPTFQKRLIALLRKAADANASGSLQPFKLDEALAGAVDDAATERDASEASWANAVRTFEVAVAEATGERAAVIASRDPQDSSDSVFQDLKLSFEAAWASAAPGNKLAEVLRCVLPGWCLLFLYFWKFKITEACHWHALFESNQL
jgi:hypothetical protein